MKKGFTLIELLMVVVLLLIVATILFPNLITLSDTVKEKQYYSQLKNILTRANEYGEDHINELKMINEEPTNANQCKIISVLDLINNGYIKADASDSSSNEKNILKNPIDNTSLNNTQVCVFYLEESNNEVSTGTHGVKTYYEVDSCIWNNGCVDIELDYK